MDATQFRQASHAVWEAMAPGWDTRHAYFEERARSVAERMLERLEPASGETVLELAAGTGVVGFAAARLVEPGGAVIVSDFSEAMVEAASRHAAALGLANVECRVLDAERLDLPDDAVDGVLCRWGYMLMPDPGAAFAETRRALRPGGRLSCAVFGAPDLNPWVALPSGVLRERGHMPATDAGGPGILALSDPDRLGRLFLGSGFSQPRIEEVGFTWSFPDVAAYWEFLTDAAGAIAMIVDRLDSMEREHVRERVAEGAERYATAAGIEIPAACLVASAS
jgi:ubiquinone/menaquinone biosynthesis C-methylase UbiE